MKLKAKELDRQQRRLLSTKICELQPTIKGTCIEGCMSQIYQELERSGISFKPKIYLTDEWGCPNRVPVIGVPFYLTDPKIYHLVSELSDIRFEDDEVIMALLRHETGHTFNYAYRLYRKKNWRLVFGRFSQPYRADYTPVPFSPEFVNHLSGWYAQRHPDDDFAETFAVWLTPNSDWRKQYSNTPALPKLLYVDEVVRKYGQQPPDITNGKLDMPMEEIKITLNEWIKKRKNT